MNVLAIVRPCRIPRLRAALTPDDRFTSGDAARLALTTAVGLSKVDVAVIDPTLTFDVRRSHVSIHALDTLRELGIPVIIYVPSKGVRASLGWVRSGAVDLVVEDIDDDAHALRRILLDAHGNVCGILVSALEARFASTTRTLRRQLRGLFLSAEPVVGTRILSMSAQMPERTLQRQLLRAGLPSAKVLIRAARVARAYVLLGDPSATCERVARTLGYSTGRKLSVDFKRVVDTPAGAARRSYAPPEFARRVIWFLEQASIGIRKASVASGLR